VVLGVDKEISAELLGLGGGKDDLEEIDNLPYHEALDRFGSRILEQALHRSNWSQTKAAELLGLQRTYLSRLLKQKGIQQCTEES
jgi:DNA-binding NtrC family response regulator